MLELFHLAVKSQDVLKYGKVIKLSGFYLPSLTLRYPQDQLIVFHIIALCRLATQPLFISSQRKNCHSGKKIQCENEYVEDCNDTKHGYKGFTRRCEGVPLRKVQTSTL